MDNVKEEQLSLLNDSDVAPPDTFGVVDIPDIPKTRIIAVEVDDEEYAAISALARENNMGLPQVLVRAAVGKVRATPPEARLLFQEMVILGMRFKEWGKKQEVPIAGMIQEMGVMLDRMNRHMSRRRKDWEEFDPDA